MIDGVFCLRKGREARGAGQNGRGLAMRRGLAAAATGEREKTLAPRATLRGLTSLKNCYGRLVPCRRVQRSHATGSRRDGLAELGCGQSMRNGVPVSRAAAGCRGPAQSGSVPAVASGSATQATPASSSCTAVAVHSPLLQNVHLNFLGGKKEGKKSHSVVDSAKFCV